MNLSVVELGRIPFKEAFFKQIQIHKQILQGNSSHTLILCEHPHTITLARQASIGNVLGPDIIKDTNIDFVMGVNRGGDITYHGPGQLVGYLIFDLRKFGRDLGWFLNRIEQAIIKTIAKFNIEGYTKKGFRGVWVGERKIASIGIGVDKWISLHGFGLNINTDLSFFDKIRPCGLNIKMTSMQGYLGKLVDMESIKREVIKQAFNSFDLADTNAYLCV
ncbi:MAG: lipoyl(octanoyl) transferase LipB [Candidatus Omnitrophica bacterium]|nr:lipoyl(octanoyl) transferase LipB [Candidatus Omnitrophota bacterium]